MVMCIKFVDLLLCFGSLFTYIFFPWVDFELLLYRLGQPLDHFGAPWFAMEVAVDCLMRYKKFLIKSNVQFRGKCSAKKSLRTRSKLAGFIPGSRGGGARAAIPNHTSLAPGASIREFTETIAVAYCRVRLASTSSPKPFPT